MQKGCIYKLKEGIELSKLSEYFTRYVFVQDFARNPLEEKTYVLYLYIDIGSMEYMSGFFGYNMLSVDEFESNFDLFWDMDDIRDKSLKMEQEK